MIQEARMCIRHKSKPIKVVCKDAKYIKDGNRTKKYAQGELREHLFIPETKCSVFQSRMRIMEHYAKEERGDCTLKGKKQMSTNRRLSFKWIQI